MRRQANCLRDPRRYEGEIEIAVSRPDLIRGGAHDILELRFYLAGTLRRLIERCHIREAAAEANNFTSCVLQGKVAADERPVSAPDIDGFLGFDRPAREIELFDNAHQGDESFINCLRFGRQFKQSVGDLRERRIGIDDIASGVSGVCWR